MKADSSCQHCGHAPHKPGKCKVLVGPDHEPSFLHKRCKCRAVPFDQVDSARATEIAHETVIQETE